MAILGDRHTATGVESSSRAELDEAAFERLHGRTSQALWGYLRRLTGDPSEADDAHQESYLRYLARPCPVDGERRQSAYLFRIATNLVHDRWRREQSERRWRMQASPLPELAAARGASLSADFETVFNQLKPRQRALLWLAYVEGNSHQEIAEILDLKAGSIKVLLFRARRRMAKLLRDSGLQPVSDLAKEMKP